VDIVLVLGDKADLVRSDIIYSEKTAGEPAFVYSGLRFLDLAGKDTRALEAYLLRHRRKATLSS
jgi:hypothetical protein